MGQNVSDTIKYYNDNAETFVSQTVNANMTGLYDRFLSKLPQKARILDAGSGSGRDTKVFRDMGHEVVAIDASIEMVRATRRLAGDPSIHASFTEYTDEQVFDGIWACASLLHVPEDDLTATLHHLSRLLTNDGWFFVSFKIGDGQQMRNGRLFNDLDAGRLKSIVTPAIGLSVAEIWETQDVRPDRNEVWLNALLVKGAQ